MWSGRRVVLFILLSIVALQAIGMFVLYQGQMAKRERRAKETVAVVHGQVLAGGEKVRGVRVELIDASGRPRTFDVPSGGWYSFAGIAPGRYQLRASGPDYEPLEKPLELGSGAHRIDLELTRRP